jgi:hypothetical protein
MKQSIFLLPKEVQRGLHRFEPEKWRIPILYLTSLKFDLLGPKKLYYGEHIFFSDNPLLVMSYILRNPSIKSFLIVPELDFASTTAFPYNLLEIADFRYLIEKMVFNYEVRNFPKQEGLNLWMDRFFGNFEHHISLNNQKLFFFDDEYQYAGLKEFQNKETKYKFIYLGKPDNKDVIDQEKNSPISRQVRRTLWNKLKEDHIVHNLYFEKEENYSESILSGEKLINYVKLTDDKAYNADNIQEWFTNCIGRINETEEYLIEKLDGDIIEK